MITGHGEPSILLCHATGGATEILALMYQKTPKRSNVIVVLYLEAV